MAFAIQLESVSLDGIVFNQHNLRGLLRDPAQTGRLATSIQRRGLMFHPIVSMMPSGYYLVVAGESRILAHMHLAKTMSQFRTITCKVLEGVSTEQAMRLLAEENMPQGLTIPAATANEVYWHYRMDYSETQDHNAAIAAVMDIWGGTQRVYENYIVPGWMIYHSPQVQRIIHEVGDRRERLMDSSTQRTAALLRHVRAGWWRTISAPFVPIDKGASVLQGEPHANDRQEFSTLMEEVFKLVEDADAPRGELAIAHLQRLVLPVMKGRLQDVLDDLNRPQEVHYAAKMRMGQVISMMKRRRIA